MGDLGHVYGLIAPNITASNNWWGTTDISTINQTIYDNKNNPSVGTVTFEPILTLSNPFASPSLISIASIINSSPALSASPSPTVPELSWLVVVPLLLSVFAVAFVFRRKHLAES